MTARPGTAAAGAAPALRSTPAATRQVETLIGVCEATLADVLRDVDAKL